MNALLKLSRMIDRLNTLVGQAVAWLCTLMVIVTFAVVIMRYMFSTGSIRMQESVIYMYALVFMLGAGFTYLNDGHVRVDIFFKQFSRMKQHWVNVLGNLFLLIPTASLILYLSIPYVLFSWRYLEGSKDSGGLDLVYLLKTAIPVMAVLLILQAVSQIIKEVEEMKKHQKEAGY